MKRELEIEVKYNGKEYEVVILKTIENKEDFTPSGRHFTNDGFTLSCCVDGRPCFDYNTLHFSKDKTVGKTSNKTTIDRMLKAVDAYNEAFKDEGKPEWCKCSSSDSGSCVDWPNKNLTIDICKNTENIRGRCRCKNIKPEFLIDKDLETVKENLIKFIGDLITDLYEHKELIIDSESVDELMQSKKDLMFCQNELPLSPSYCYYCMKNGFKLSRLIACNECSYGKKHGKCGNNKSVFDNIIIAKDNLQKAIERY